MWVKRAVPVVDCSPLLCFSKHNRTAVQILIREDMKKMVQLPILKNLSTSTTTEHPGGQRVFGVTLVELEELGLVQDGVPSVLRSMVEFLRQDGLQQEGLFRVSASVRAVESLKQRLDRGEELDLKQEAEVSTVAGLLKQFLRELPEGLIHPSVHHKLLHLHHDSSDGSCKVLRDLLQQLPAVHYSVLQFICQFLTQVEQQQSYNRMSALNLATVFGPNVFHVSAGFEGMQEQSICNKIMAKLIQNYSSIFESDGHEAQPKTRSTIIMVREVPMDTAPTETPPHSARPNPPTPVPGMKVSQSSAEENNPTGRRNTATTPRKKKVKQRHHEEERLTELTTGPPVATPRKNKVTRKSSEEEGISPRRTDTNPTSPVDSPRKKVKKVKVPGSLPNPAPSSGLPFSRHLSECTDPRLHSQGRSFSPRADGMDSSPPTLSPIRSTDTLTSLQDDERPISPFYVSAPLRSDEARPDLTQFLEKTIRSTVEQHLFDAHIHPGQSSQPGADSPVSVMTARQRRRQQRQAAQTGQEVTQERCRDDKENIPSHSPNSVMRRYTNQDAEGRPRSVEEVSRTRMSKHVHSNNQSSHREAVREVVSPRHWVSPQVKIMSDDTDCAAQREGHKPDVSMRPRTPAMKIQEAICGSSDGCEDVPRLDLSTLTEDSSWGEPVPAYSLWQREGLDPEEARLSPQPGGKMIRQLLEEDSDPMLSPRFYAYGNSQQYLDDTEVPPSPPNTHSFISRRRSSSLGSCEAEPEELTSTQLSKKIHNLKKKIRKFEERFEEERKYRPSHSDKAANPEVLRWMNELAKLRKDLKEHHLMKSEEDLAPLPRQRSNTLPKSFGSQLEKKSSEPKCPKPPVENTMEAVMNKLQEKRNEAGRPDDIKDMTREQIGAEKVALQKALLYYEGIHGRPITKTERQLMKPLYDRYRLVKQILCRVSTIPVIGSPSTKRRGPQLQPIIEGVPALFFVHSKEEEDGSDEDSDSRVDVTQLMVRPELNMLGFLDHLDEDVDGFISPVDELSPTNNMSDMRLSNLHAANIQELVEQLQEAREEKKRIRKNLREFEDQFFRENGRNVQKEDRAPLAVEYNEYKHIKAKLRLLEVLISKRDSAKFI